MFTVPSAISAQQRRRYNQARLHKVPTTAVSAQDMNMRANVSANPNALTTRAQSVLNKGEKTAVPSVNPKIPHAIAEKRMWNKWLVMGVAVVAITLIVRSR